MASLAYVLALSTGTPPDETDGEWCSRCYSWQNLLHWKYVERTSDEERELDGGIFDTPALSSNASAAKHKDDPDVIAMVERWWNERYRPWVEAGRPSPRPSRTVADYEELSGEESRLGVSSLVRYRGGFKPVARKKLPSGASHAFLSNVADPYEFEGLTRSGDTELMLLRELCRIYGGRCLAIWTWGHSVHVWHGASAGPDAPDVTLADFRLWAPCGRSPRALENLREAMQGGPFAPDFEVLQSQLDAPSISVETWFRAFGVEGAAELVPTDRAEVWARFERTALAHLAGQPADAGDVRALNTLIGPIDEDARLKAKPGKRAGQRASAVSQAARVLAEAVGEPDDETWRRRFAAARTFHDIGEGPAMDRLLTRPGPFGHAAGLGRLLGHYPPDLARDPLFLPLAAGEAEAANGHEFVEPLYLLAEAAGVAGFTLAVYPGEADGAFKKALKVDGGPLEPASWAAHAFIDLPKAEPSKVMAALEAWFSAQGADGLVLRAQADGSFRLLRFEDGASREDVPADGDAVADAARRLVPRAAFRALGHDDLLEPGEWTEGAYEGPSAATSEYRRQHRRAATEALDGSAETTPLQSCRDLERQLGTSVHALVREETHDRLVAVRLEPPCEDPEELQRLRNDLAAVDSAAQAWVDGGRATMAAFSGFSTGLLAATVADLPEGTSVRVAGRDGLFAWLRAP